MTWRVLILASLAAGLALAHPASAKAADAARAVAEAAFSATERQVIEEFYRAAGLKRPEAPADKTSRKDRQDRADKPHKSAHGKDKPSGPGGAGGLPPGLQRQIEKNGTLPPGLAKRDLPPDLVRRLPAARPGTDRVVIDGDIVLIEKATGVVLDILRDVVRGR